MKMVRATADMTSLVWWLGMTMKIHLLFGFMALGQDKCEYPLWISHQPFQKYCVNSSLASHFINGSHNLLHSSINRPVYGIEATRDNLNLSVTSSLFLNTLPFEIAIYHDGWK
jgi:hypothetical protein